MIVWWLTSSLLPRSLLAVFVGHSSSMLCKTFHTRPWNSSATNIRTLTSHWQLRTSHSIYGLLSTHLSSISLHLCLFCLNIYFLAPKIINYPSHEVKWPWVDIGVGPPIWSLSWLTSWSLCHWFGCTQSSPCGPILLIVIIFVDHHNRLVDN